MTDNIGVGLCLSSSWFSTFYLKCLLYWGRESMYMHVYLCVSMHVWMCVHVCLCMFMCVCVCVHEYVCACVVWVCLSVYMYVCGGMCLCVHVCLCGWAYVCVYEYIYIYTHSVYRMSEGNLESLLFLPWVQRLEPRPLGLVASSLICWAILRACHSL